MNTALLGPESPIRGLNSYVDPMYLPEGFWQELRNVRWDQGVVKVRDGDEAVLSAPVAGTFRGAGLFPDESTGFLVLFCAIEVSSKLRFYRIIYDVGAAQWQDYSTGATANTWVEVSSDGTPGVGISAKYGDTRYMDPPDRGYVQFVRAPIPEGGGVGISGYVVVAMNGKDEPLKLTTELTGTPDLATAKVEDVDPPGWASTARPRAEMADVWDLASVTAVGTGTALTNGLTQSGSAYIIEDAPGAGNDVLTFTMASSGTLTTSGSRQIVLIVQGTVDEFLAKCKLSTSNSTDGAQVFYDPSLDYISYVRFDGAQDQFDYTLLAFEIPDTTRSADTDFIVEATEDLSADFSIDFKMIAASGRVPGSAQYAISYYNQGSRTESPGVVMPTASGVTVNAWLERVVSYDPVLDRPDSVAEVFGFEVPVLNNVYYQFRIPMQNPSSTEVAKGVQTINFYRADSPDGKFYYETPEVLTDYGVSWTVDNGVAGGPTGTDHVDNNPTHARNYSRIAPTSFNQAFPVSVTATYGNNRMYAGGFKDGAADSATTVFVSEQDQPMRFSQIADFDESEINFRTAFTADLGEPIRAFVDTSASVVGSSAVYCFTSKSTFAISDWLVKRIGSNGCIGPDAICSYDQQIYFVDEELVVRLMQGSVQQISRTTVHDKLTQAVEPDKISLAAFGDRVYVAYQDSAESTAGNRVLVWHRVFGNWESDDSTATGKTVAQFLPFRYNGDSRLLFLAEDSDVFRYEDPASTDLDGSPIPFEMRTGAIKGDLFREVTLGQLGIVSEDTTGSVTVTRTVLARGATTPHTSTISLDSTGASNWREDDSHRAVDGFYGDYKVSGNLSAGLTLRAIYARIDGGGHGSD